MRKTFTSIHRDTKGAISVLVLLTIWCLIAMIAMIWNNAELSTKRQLVQNAADSAAHSTATLNARMTNMVASQNIIIAQDAAAEAISRSVTPTYDGINAELQNELKSAQAMLSGSDPTVNQLRSSLIGMLRQADQEYVQTQAALDQITSSANTITFPNKQSAAVYQNQLRQAGDALKWVSGTYMDGGMPAHPGFPGAPGQNGEGLRKLVSDLAQNTKLTDQMLEAIIASIVQQLAILETFRAQTAPGADPAVWSQLFTHEQKVCDNEETMLNELKDALKAQQDSLANFYKVQLASARQYGQVSGEEYSSNTDPDMPTPLPVIRADDTAMIDGHPDSIRMAYPKEAADADLSTYVTISPINPNTGEDRIWHPNVIVPVPTEFLWLFVNSRTPPAFGVNCNEPGHGSFDPGGWGHMYAFPVERYVSNRVWNDQQNLNNDYMAPIDRLRQQLAQQLSQMTGTTQENITPPANQLPDWLPDPVTKSSTTISVLPKLTPPPSATSTYRTEVLQYNQHAQSYISRVRQLARAMTGFGRFWSRFTRPLAVPIWTANISDNRFFVLYELGSSPAFYVLASYQLHAIPEWAGGQDVSGAMGQSADLAVYNKIVSMNFNPVSQAILARLIAVNPEQYKGSKAFLQAMYSVWSSQITLAILQQPEVQQAAMEIATEMVAREWPYEMAPPADVVPPSRGMGRPDRQRYFSTLVAAQLTEANSPKPVLQTIFGSPPTLAAYAQAETINWMEYNANYGGSERFDQVSTDGYGSFLCCPRAWRTCSVGGWNWQPRLALSDMLGPALQNEQNGDFKSILNSAGLTGTDKTALDVVNLH